MVFASLEDAGFGQMKGHVAHFDVATHFAAGFAVLLVVFYGLGWRVHRAVGLL